MLLRLSSLLILFTIAVLSVSLIGLARLPFQPGFVYDMSDPRFILTGYIDFVFIIIVALIIILIIGRPTYEAALKQEGLSRFDKVLYKLMCSLPLVLITCLCSAVLLAITLMTFSLGFG